MDSTDTEMDTETATQSSEATTNSYSNDSLRSLLTLARQFINQGKPSQALQAAWLIKFKRGELVAFGSRDVMKVMMALRSDGGEEAVFQTLHRAREQYQNRLQANAAADQLASLFAECAIAEALPSEPKPSPLDTGNPSVAPVAYETSILAKTGRKQLVMDAFSDGSSFICLQCGGLVSNNRREEHFAFWCCQT